MTLDPIPKDAADSIGLGGIWFDPLWRVEVSLTPLEQALLDSWPVRRLDHITHAGAGALTTTQRYSRLEHSLGVLALVVHFAPDDELARAAALLHDVGHLPFSHTLEGIEGLDHHKLGRSRIRAMSRLLAEHGLDADKVIAVDEGRIPSRLTSRPGGLKLDHLDSFLRSGQSHGRTGELPSSMLERLRLVDGTVETDERTGAELVRLAVSEARAQRSLANVTPVAVLRHLVTTMLTAPDPELTSEELAVMTDDELVLALRRDPATAEDTDAFRKHPLSWEPVAETTASTSGPEGNFVLQHQITRSYLDVPTVDGALLQSPELERLHNELPVRYAFRR